MNDENSNDDWIDKARIEIYEETKNMSNEEILEYFRKFREEAAKKYDFLSDLLFPKSSDNDNKE